jgi:hypothetical protein
MIPEAYRTARTQDRITPMMGRTLSSLLNVPDQEAEKQV